MTCLATGTPVFEALRNSTTLTVLEVHIVRAVAHHCGDAAFVHLTCIGLIQFTVSVFFTYSHLGLWFHHAARIDPQRHEFALVGLLELDLDFAPVQLLCSFHLILSDTHL